jgi:hypothetical protein
LYKVKQRFVKLFKASVAGRSLPTH